jgi:hypothetical protein
MHGQACVSISWSRRGTGLWIPSSRSSTCRERTKAKHRPTSLHARTARARHAAIHVQQVHAPRGREPACCQQCKQQTQHSMQMQGTFALCRLPIKSMNIWCFYSCINKELSRWHSKFFHALTLSCNYISTVLLQYLQWFFRCILLNRVM